ncbi:uncharacterized protein LOC115691148 [Syzygium oleosum]|uniref:uncharacterized protein LOC115691148 n=1 Tax=Syzygium oleosum TaxID=219896 RepID=UPI0011D1E3CA|nr:uncharacterized protein LOC115691148 [Syzygium oleosum]
MGQEARDPRMDEVIHTLQEIENLMSKQAQERATNIAQAAEAAATAAINGNQANLGQAQVAGNRQMHQLVEQFLKLKPPKFNGRGDPEAAPRWVEELEKAFEVLGCTETEKVTLAVYQLQDNVNDWWKATRDRVFPKGTVQTWAAFTESFYGKYFSESAQERKLAEFMRLRQGQMTVDQYEAEFARLSKFAPRMVENLQDKVRRFRDGLKPDLRSQMISLNIQDYGEMYERVQAIERDQLERAAASGSRFTQTRDNRHFGKKPMAGNRRFIPSARKNIGKPSHQPNRFGACFKCGSLEHQIGNCPQQRPSGLQMRP